jgi:uncharacterized membrane protein
MLVHFPTGLYPFSLVTDIIGLASLNEKFFNASIYALFAAVGMSVPAMLYGLIDFLKVDTNSQAWKKAGLHALLNLLWFMIFCTLLFYRTKHPSVGVSYVIIMAITIVGMFYSNFLGADLIISHRIGIDSDEEQKEKRT